MRPFYSPTIERSSEMKASRHARMITASEVGDYVFCAKAWQLKLEGARPDSQRLAAGTDYHRAHQSGVHWTLRLRQWGVRLAWLAIAAAVLWLISELWL